jgi:hypothetical protein
VHTTRLPVNGDPWSKLLVPRGCSAQIHGLFPQDPCTHFSNGYSEVYLFLNSWNSVLLKIIQEPTVSIRNYHCHHYCQQSLCEHVTVVSKSRIPVFNSSPRQEAVLGSDVQIHTFLTTALNNEWQVSRADRLIRKERAPIMHCIRNCCLPSAIQSLSVPPWCTIQKQYKLKFPSFRIRLP